MNFALLYFIIGNNIWLLGLNSAMSQDQDLHQACTIMLATAERRLEVSLGHWQKHRDGSPRCQLFSDYFSHLLIKIHSQQCSIQYLKSVDELTSSSEEEAAQPRFGLRRWNRGRGPIRSLTFIERLTALTLCGLGAPRTCHRHRHHRCRRPALCFTIIVLLLLPIRYPTGSFSDCDHEP